MTVAKRRACAVALVVGALVVVGGVAVTLGIRSLAARTPGTLQQETVAASSASTHPESPEDAGNADTAATAGPLADAVVDTPVPTFVPPTTDLSAYDLDLDLAGVVVDPYGAPVEEATVQAVFHPARMPNLREASPVALLGPVTRSGVGGAFGVRLLPGQQAGLRVTAAGFVPSELGPATAGQRVLVIVRPAVSCVVTLRDADGRPAAGLTVLLEHRALPEFPREVLLHREALSDAEGRARFADLPGGLAVAVDVVSGGQSWDDSTRRTLPLRGTLGIELTVPPGRTLRGRVTDGRTGRPIPGAQVRVSVPRGGAATTTADADGHYALRGVPEPTPRERDDEPPPAAPWISVTADAYVAASAAVPDGSVHDVSLEPAATVTGRAVDGGGQPLASAWVFLVRESRIKNRAAGMPPDWERTPATMTDTDGRFQIATRARYGGLRVEAVAYAPLHRSIARAESAARPIDVGDLVLGPGLILEGHVFDGDGHPMPGVRLRLDDVRVTSDDLGRYRMRDLAPGRHVLRAVANGRDQLERAVTLSPDSEPTVLDVAFPAGREVTIEVHDASGVPVVGAGVDVVHRRIREPTDAQGRRIVVLPPGPWKVRVAGGTHRHADGRRVFVSREAEIPADATHLVVTLDRTPPPEDMRTITGTVVDDDARPVEGVGLLVTWEGSADPSQRVEHVRSGEDGGFAVRVPKTTVCDIRADSKLRTDGPPSKHGTRAPWVGESTGVGAGRTDVVVVARPEPPVRTVTVRVLSPDGDPLPGVRVRLSGGLQERVRALTGQDGRAELSGLVHRSCSVSADPPEPQRDEWLAAHSPSFLPAGQEIALRFRRATEVTGRVLLADGAPARGAYVTLRAGSTRRGAQVDASGRFQTRVDAALPLPWRLTALLNQDWPRTEVSLDLATPPSGDVTIRFPDPTQR